MTRHRETPEQLCYGPRRHTLTIAPNTTTIQSRCYDEWLPRLHKQSPLFFFLLLFTMRFDSTSFCSVTHSIVAVQRTTQRYFGIKFTLICIPIGEKEIVHCSSIRCLVVVYSWMYHEMENRHGGRDGMRSSFLFWLNWKRGNENWSWIFWKRNP